MHRLNRLFVLSSLSVLLVTVERFSFTTRVLLQPYSFMRLHEMVQMCLIILLTVIIPFFVIQRITDDFKSVSLKKGPMFLLLFLVGVYFYATGNGVHELASFQYNHFCTPPIKLMSPLCEGFFFNDYYTGNIMYFFGGILMVLATLLLELDRPDTTFKKSDLRILIINALVYALAIFAYAAFDKVVVGLVYCVILSILSIMFYLKIRKNYLAYPVITYTTLTYVIATAAALVVRIMK